MVGGGLPGRSISFRLMETFDISVDDSGMDKDKVDTANSSVVTLEPFEINKRDSSTNIAISSILHARPIPLDWSFDVICGQFSSFGTITEIRNKLGNNYQFFESWIFFKSDKEALKAYKEFHSNTVRIEFAKIDDVPHHLDIYRPVYHDDDDLEISNSILRHPDPPKWLIMSTHERGNLFRVKKLLDQKLGHIKRPDISRFGRNSFLIHAKSDGQSVMLSNLKLEAEGPIREIKPHYNFSYARGVIFNEDLYEMTEDEILALCPEVVWKIYKVPRSSMIIITFKNSALPSEIVLDCEIVRVRPYKPRVLQCFTCFGFGHASRKCTRNKICVNCSQPEHGDCSRSKVCVNCKEEHQARDKNCKVLKREQEALLKSIAEHISIGHAKKLLARNSYSDVLRATSGGAPRAPSGGAPRAPSGGAPRAPSGGAPRAPSGGAPPAPSGGASPAPSGGAPPGPSGGAPLAPPPVAKSASIKDLDEFFLPDITVHRSKDGEEMEAQAVRPKRPLPPPSPPSRSRSHDRNTKNKNERPNDGPAPKKSSMPSRSHSNESIPGKVSLSPGPKFLN